MIFFPICMTIGRTISDSLQTELKNVVLRVLHHQELQWIEQNQTLGVLTRMLQKHQNI